MKLINANEVVERKRRLKEIEAERNAAESAHCDFINVVECKDFRYRVATVSPSSWNDGRPELTGFKQKLDGTFGVRETRIWTWNGGWKKVAA